jgi:hypothetical protein
MEHITKEDFLEADIRLLKRIATEALERLESIDEGHIKKLSRDAQSFLLKSKQEKQRKMLAQNALEKLTAEEKKALGL